MWYHSKAKILKIWTDGLNPVFSAVLSDPAPFEIPYSSSQMCRIFRIISV